MEARTALLPAELGAQREAVAEPDAQREAVVAAAEPVAQQQAVAAVAEPVAQQQAVAAVAEPVAQQQAVVVAEPVAQQQAAAVAARAMQPGVRPLVASVELAETAVVRFWIREASFLVRAPE